MESVSRWLDTFGLHTFRTSCAKTARQCWTFVALDPDMMALGTRQCCLFMQASPRAESSRCAALGLLKKQPHEDTRISTFYLCGGIVLVINSVAARHLRSTGFRCLMAQTRLPQASSRLRTRSAGSRVLCTVRQRHMRVRHITRRRTPHTSRDRARCALSLCDRYVCAPLVLPVIGNPSFVSSSSLPILARRVV